MQSKKRRRILKSLKINKTGAIKALFTACLILLASLGFGQILDDSTKVVYGPGTSSYFYKNDLKYNKLKLYKVDTSIKELHHFGLVNQHDNKMQDLGNNGTALSPIFYAIPEATGVTSGFNAYLPYFLSPSKRKFFDTKSPFSKIYLVFGGIGRSATEVEYSRNVNPRWNLGGAFSRIKSDKQISRARKDDRMVLSNAYEFYTSYKDKKEKYNLLVHFSRLGHSVIESGGIVPTSVDPDSELFGYNEDAKIWLTTAETRELKVNYHVYHQYKFSDYAQIYHELNRENQFVDFINTDLGASADGPFFRDIFQDSLMTFDRSKYRLFQNEAGVKGNITNAFYNFYYKRRDLKFEHKYISDEGYFSENYGGFRLRYDFNEETNLGGGAEYQQGGNYTAEAALNHKNLTISAKKTQYSPSFTDENYSGNHRQWSNDFKSIQAENMRAQLNLQVKSLLVQPFAEYTSLSDYVYYGTDTIPGQAQGKINIFSPGIQLHLGFLKNMHFEFEGIYTDLGGADADKIRIPEVFVNSKLYYQNMLFKGNMFAQIGFDIHSKSSYFPSTYDPVMMRYFLQDNFEAEQYWLVDFFINFRVNRARLFAKVNNITRGLQADGYFRTPYYTGVNRTFDFGINWQFFD